MHDDAKMVSRYGSGLEPGSVVLPLRTLEQFRADDPSNFRDGQAFVSKAAQVECEA